MQGIFGDPTPAVFLPDGEEGQTRETEIKFRYAGDVALLQRALNVWPRHRPKQKQLRSTYYDTSEFDLWKNGVTLRVRQDGKQPFRMGIKSGGGQNAGSFSRTEIEVEIPQAEPDLAAFKPWLGKHLGRLRHGRPLVPHFETRVTRTSWVVAAGASVIEVVLDEGEIALPGGRTQALREVEFELMDGEPRDLYELARIIALRLDLSLELASKSDRGFAMLLPGTVSPRKAVPIVLPGKQTLDDAIEAILSSTLHHFVGNWMALRETDAPESVHQLRVALRRLRSAFKILRRTLRTDLFEELREDARQIAKALGPARELDSFIAVAEAGALSRLAKPEGNEYLMSVARTLREERYKAARAAIDDRRSTLFVLRLQSIIANRGWSDGIPARTRSKLAKRVRGASRLMLDRLLARVLEKGRGLSDRSDAERHDLRIALKDLRYAIEFFASAFGKAKARQKLLQAVSRLQDILGKHNDAVGVDNLVKRLSEGGGANAAHAAGYLIGWHAHEMRLNDMELQQTWRNFKKLNPFWR